MMKWTVRSLAGMEGKTWVIEQGETLIAYSPFEDVAKRIAQLPEMEERLEMMEKWQVELGGTEDD